MTSPFELKQLANAKTISADAQPIWVASHGLELLQLAVRVGGIGIFESDLEQRQTRFSPELCSILGLPVGTQMTYEEASQLIHESDRAAVMASVETARTSVNDGTWHIVHRIVRADGAIRWVSTHGRRHYRETPDGRVPVRSIGTVVDITARKALEREAEELSKRLLTLQEEERQRIAQELHDSTAQHLVAANLNLMSLKSKAVGGREVVELLDEVETSMSEALKELRTLSYLMYPPVLQGHGLRETIRQYIDGYARRSQLEVRFKSNPKADRLPFREQQLLYRIVQEALANIHHHAAASYVSVDLRWISNQLHLIIGDNGSGIGCRAQYGESELFRTGVGIRAIRARVHQLGGDLKIRTGSLGTKIHVAMPAVG